jgi:hypothetical protein
MAQAAVPILNVIVLLENQHMAAGPMRRYLAPMANYLLKLFGPKRGASDRPGLGEVAIPAQDDLSAIRRLKDSYPERLEECDCAELYNPDGKLVWEQHDEP